MCGAAYRIQINQPSWQFVEAWHTPSPPPPPLSLSLLQILAAQLFFNSSTWVSLLNRIAGVCRFDLHDRQSLVRSSQSLWDDRKHKG